MTLIECACGCGELREDRDEKGRPRRFIRYHNSRGSNNSMYGNKHSEKARKKMSEANKGEKHPFYGKKLPEKTRRKISEAQKGEKHHNYGKKLSEKTRKKMSKAHKGKIISEEQRKKISEAKKGEKHHFYGKKLSKEHRIKLSKALKGENNPHYGKKHSEETLKKLSEMKKGKHNPNYGKKFTEEHCNKISEAQKGDKSHNWIGGISFEPYCSKFNNSFKEYIRKKFNYQCFICEKSQNKIMDEMRYCGKRAFRLCIHHVNYNKNCLCEDNKCEFIPLCPSCHSKTNNNREYWEKVILEKLNLY